MGIIVHQPIDNKAQDNANIDLLSRFFNLGGVDVCQMAYSYSLL